MTKLRIIALITTIIISVLSIVLFIIIKKPFDFQNKINAPGCDWAYEKDGEIYCVADVESSGIIATPENSDAPVIETPVIPESQTNLENANE